ncbi:MAG TPA: amino acid permease [Saprospiraceae bacterium]|nr:amino acid permease [Saprospiraceae bacterium]
MQELARTLNLKAAIAIIVGSIIGSGIFMKPALMAGQVGSGGLLLLVWFIAGLITFCGALTNAELACMFPETGGQYIYFKKIYGDRFAFMYAWASFIVFNTAGNASIAYVCSQYAHYFISFPELNPLVIEKYSLFIPGIGRFFPLQNYSEKILCILFLGLFTAINMYSTKESSRLQNVLTILKVASIVLVISSAVFHSSGSADAFFHFSFNSEGSLITAMMLAMSGAFWAYDGWNNISFIGGEITNPQKIIPKSLFIGMVLCILIYIMMNMAYLYVIPFDSIVSTKFIASELGTKVLGAIGAGIITLIVIMSTLGTINSNVLSTSRVTFALGQDHPWFRAAAKVHPVYGTPAIALLFNFGWSTVLVLSGSFDMLTDMLIVFSWFFYMMSALGVIYLRLSKPNIPRPFKVIGYPWVPLVFIGFTAFYLVIQCYNDLHNYFFGVNKMSHIMFGLFLVLIGLPIYYFGRRSPN